VGLFWRQHTVSVRLDPLEVVTHASERAILSCDQDIKGDAPQETHGQRIEKELRPLRPLLSAFVRGLLFLQLARPGFVSRLRHQFRVGQSDDPHRSGVILTNFEFQRISVHGVSTLDGN